jgi:Peptidase family M28
MRNRLLFLIAVMSACSSGDVSEGEGDANEGEGDANEGEGDANEGEGDANEGEGDANEGEGDAGEGEGDAGEGEGDAGEGEGDAGEGEVEPAGLLPVDAQLIEQDLVAVAVPRPPGSANWALAQARCEERLTALGYTVVQHVYATGTNIIGTLPGANNAGAVVLSAHYDSISDCDGADDNASGVAATLEAARMLAAGRYDNDLIVACWDEEELGLVGSRAWAADAAAMALPITMMFSLETIGYSSSAPDSQRLPFGLNFIFPTQAQAIEDNDNRGDFIAFIGNPATTASNMAMALDAAAVGLPLVSLLLTNAQVNNPLLADLQRSDHSSFWEQGYPGVMLTDTANFRNAAYHCMGTADSIDRLDIGFIARVTDAVARTTRTLLVAR